MIHAVPEGPHEGTGNKGTENTGQVSILGVLGLMTFCAVLLGVGRWLGPTLSFSCFLTGYAFAPSLALLLMLAMRAYSLRVRCLAGGLTLIFFAAVMTLLAGYRWGAQAMPFVVAGTIIEWPGQILVIGALRMIAVAKAAAPQELTTANEPDIVRDDLDEDRLLGKAWGRTHALRSTNLRSK